MKKNNGRQKGAKDLCKRRTKKFLTVKDERYIKEHWNDKTIKWFAEYFDVCPASILNVAKRNKLPQRESIAKSRYCSLESMKDKVGIYGIITSDGMIYIGSSTNIYVRVKAHINLLKNNGHFNKSLQSSITQSLIFS